MTYSEKTRKFIRALLVFIILVVIVIIGYETLILTNVDTLYPTVSSQEWVSQRLAKDALLLEYGNGDGKTTALAEFQNSVPYFEQNEAKIASMSKSQAVSLLLRASQPSYVNIDTAARKILAEKPGDPNLSEQVQIILDNERVYFLARNQVVSLLVQEGTAKYWTIFSIIISGKLIIIVTCMIEMALLEKKLFNENDSHSHRMNTQESVGEHNEN